MSSANERPQLALNNCDVIMLQVTPIKMSGNLMLSTGSMVQTRSLLTSISNEGQRVQELLIPCPRTDKKMGFVRPLRNINWFTIHFNLSFQHTAHSCA